MSLPVRGVWIEICIIPSNPVLLLSLPVMGVWIEISQIQWKMTANGVTPCEGSVD